MKRHLLIPNIIILLTMLTVSIGAAGQSRWGFDCRPSMNFPTTLFLGSKLEPGFGFDVQVTYRIIDHLYAYSGWGWTRLPQNKTNADALSLDKMGTIFGMKFLHPLNRFNFEYYIKGGAAYQHVNVQKTTEKNNSSAQRWGWQVESGLSFPLDDNIALQPGLKYSTFSGSIDKNGSMNAFHLNDLSAGIVLSVTFGRKH